MNYLFVTTAFVLTMLTIGTSCGQMTPVRPAPVPKEQGSQLIPSAQAPFPIEFPASPGEPKKETVGSGTSAPPKAPVSEAKKQVHVVRKPSYRPRERQATGDSTADYLNRQELSRVTGVYQGY